MSPFLQDLAAQQLERIVSPAEMDAEYILESLEQARPMLSNLAYQYNMDGDDLYQEAYLVAHKIMADPQKPHHRAYIQGAIRLHVYDLLRHRPSAASLDAPIGEDGDTSLIDMLVETARPQQTRRDYYRKRALLKALRRLPEKQQRAINLFYRIERLAPRAAKRNIAKHTISSYRSVGLNQLREDKYLNKAIMQNWR
jgi:DNA-directed RNA polymerase specialized sigma24 family protein